MNYIKVKGLSKSYSDINALKNLSMEIEAGTLFGILGPNGAGKSTLIKILATLIEPDSGEVFINNINLIKNSRKIRELIGYVAQDIALDKILTGRELLDFQSDLYHINKNKKFSSNKNSFLYNHEEKKYSVFYKNTQRNKMFNLFQGNTENKLKALKIAEELADKSTLTILRKGLRDISS